MPEQPKIQFTPAQAAAISARGGSLLVSAAAGSGKTRVLVERVVGLITDPVHPVDANQLLIMTFTNAAAAKLRADITTRLAQEVRAHPGDLHLRSQQLLLQRASIGTVDAFCLHFVQQHFAMLDVPPDFETADEADLARIEQETLAATLETAYQDPDFRAFADLYDRGRTDNTAGDAILDLYHFTRALPHPAASLAAFAAMWQQDAPPKDTLWGKELLGIALARAQGAKTLLESGAAIAARDEAADRAYTAVMQDDAARVKNLCYYLKEGDWDKSLAALDAVLTGWRRAGSVKGGKDANQCASAASQLRDRAKDQMTSLQKDVLLCTAEEFAADRRRAAPLVAALVRATQAFADSCFAAKCAEKVLDYADYEHLTLDLLLTETNERTPLCATVSARYAAVLVDEYQDTNALQDAIYFALARPEADNLFFVGDIKQSIYRFRLADPGIFVDKQQRWQPHPQPAPLPSTLALDANFRSAPGVIAGINYLFETFFSRGWAASITATASGLWWAAIRTRPIRVCVRSTSSTVQTWTATPPSLPAALPRWSGRASPCAARTARGPAGTMTSAFCCAGARALRPTRVRCAPQASRCLRTPPPTCWTSRTSARLRHCCASSTTLRRTSRWRRCC